MDEQDRAEMNIPARRRFFASLMRNSPFSNAHQAYSRCSDHSNNILLSIGGEIAWIPGG
jgi:hypothetical protein